MNQRTTIVFIVTVILIGGAAGLLATFQARQKLGDPGVKTVPTSDPKRLQVVLPENVLNYKSTEVPVDKMVLDTLPADTSFGQREYAAPDGFRIALNVVLMGSDRTSLHKPQFCLEGQGWKIDPAASAGESIRVARPQPYDLPVMKLISTKQGQVGGQPVTARGVYVYYYVADDAISAGSLGGERMWLMAREMMTTGVLQRWAYITFFGICSPGQEEAAYNRIKQFVAASAPEFQLTPRPMNVEPWPTSKSR